MHSQLLCSGLKPIKFSIPVEIPLRSCYVTFTAGLTLFLYPHKDDPEIMGLISDAFILQYMLCMILLLSQNGINIGTGATIVIIDNSTI